MSILEKELEAEKTKLEEQERYLRKELAEAWKQFRYVDSRLWLVSGLLGRSKE